MSTSEIPEQSTRRPGLAMTIGGILLAALLLFVARAYLSPGHAMAGWETNWDAGITRSAETGKPMLVLFTADWCGPCRQLKSEVLSEPAVAQRLQSDYVLIKVDLTDRQSLGNEQAQKFAVRGIPTLILFSSDGTQINRMTGGTSIEGLLEWLDTSRPKK